VVVDDLDVMSVSADPAKADPPLVVDANAVLAETIGGELLQTVRRGHPEVSKAGGGIENEQFAKGNSVKIRGHPSDPLAPKESLGVGVTEASDHG
jgi:hypothetical protein